MKWQSTPLCLTLPYLIQLRSLYVKEAKGLGARRHTDFPAVTPGRFRLLVANLFRQLQQILDPGAGIDAVSRIPSTNSIAHPVLVLAFAVPLTIP